jgi:PTH1 family peptidyl-tRNA hydrolase
MEEISIVCGLGNPGPRYRATRHNLGFMALDALSERHSFSWGRSAGPAETARWRVAGRLVTLVKPLTWMNESGLALERLGPIEPASLLVVCDDLNLPLGRLRMRSRGGAGGHRGLESIIGRLGTEEFARLRLGIGGAPSGADRVEFVLADIPREEREAVDGMLEAAAAVIETAVHAGLEVAMRLANRPGDPPGGARKGPA